MISQVEAFLLAYLRSERPLEQGLPTVVQCAEAVHLSYNYLSDLLRKETGKTTQEHIHFFLIEEAKTELLTSQRPVNEIAFRLGFEYPQYFSKLFKRKVGLTPSQYRNGNQ
ncbi:MAG: helix-turn-helix transcriptional regulator [Bacteroidota bacterium]